MTHAHIRHYPSDISYIALEEMQNVLVWEVIKRTIDYMRVFDYITEWTIEYVSFTC